MHACHQMENLQNGDDTQMLHLIFINSSHVADKIVFSKLMFC